MGSTREEVRQGEFERQLQERRDELRHAIREGLHAMGEATLAQDLRDIGDDSLATWIQNLQVVDLHRDVEELNDIEEALERVRNGTYGSCVDCGDPVPAARLRAYPTAKRCLECQEIHERRSRRGA